MFICKEKVAVVIPIYRLPLTAAESLSFDQCINTLRRHRIIILAPKRLKSQAEELIVNSNLSLVILRDENFVSTHSYNKLLLSPWLYLRFSRYSYMLVCQLDAFVFKNNLLYWCELGYDYIGAPWFEGYDEANKHSDVLGVGNGGVSLRKTSKMLTLLMLYHPIQQWKLFWRASIHNNVVAMMRALIGLVFPTSKYSLTTGSMMNEDYYICTSSCHKLYSINVAPYETARRFSFEANPSRLYKENENELPFACHAWQRYEPEFWEKHIPTEHM